MYLYHQYMQHNKDSSSSLSTSSPPRICKLRHTQPTTRPKIKFRSKSKEPGFVKTTSIHHNPNKQKKSLPSRDRTAGLKITIAR